MEETDKTLSETTYNFDLFDDAMLEVPSQLDANVSKEDREAIKHRRYHSWQLHGLSKSGGFHEIHLKTL